MWLLKLHFAISVLCLITFVGFKAVMRNAIRENGYMNSEKEKKDIKGYLIFFVPILNIIAVVTLFLMILTKKEDLDKWCEEHKKK